MCYGDFQGSFEVKELGVRIKFGPGDILLVRGSVLRHKAGKWEGNGCFVIVPFCDRRLFTAERIKRTTTAPPLYGSSWIKSQFKYPYKDLYYVSEK